VSLVQDLSYTPPSLQLLIYLWILLSYPFKGEHPKCLLAEAPLVELQKYPFLSSQDIQELCKYTSPYRGCVTQLVAFAIKKIQH
jgi:hypothetical protein